MNLRITGLSFVLLLAGCGGGGGGSGSGGDSTGTDGGGESSLEQYAAAEMEGPLADCMLRAARAEGWSTPADVKYIECTFSAIDEAPYSLAGVDGFENIEELYVYPTDEYLASDDALDLGYIGATEELASLDRLRVLVLNFQALDELTLPESCALEILDVSVTPLLSIAPASRCKSLQYVGLAQTNVTDLAPLAGLSHIETLDISINDIHDLSPLESATGLKWLFMDYMGASFSALAQYSDDQDIVLPGFFAGFTQMEGISADSMHIANLSVLSGAKNFWYLRLNKSRLQARALLPFPKLQYLFLAESEITDVMYLARLTELQVLDLSNATVNDSSRYAWSFLGNLDKVRQLGLIDNGFDNIGTLLDMNALEFVLLESARIENLELLADLPSLEYIDLGINGLTTVSNSTCDQVAELQALNSAIDVRHDGCD